MRLLLAQDPGVHDRQVPGGEDRCGVADAVGLQLLEFRHQPVVHLIEPNVSVDLEPRHQILGAEPFGSDLVEPLSERRQVLAAVERHAGSGSVAAELGEQVRYPEQRPVHVEGRDRAGRPSHLIPFNRKENGGPVVGLEHP